MTALSILLVGSTSSGVQATERGSTRTGISRVDSAGTVWLCRPGLTHNPCAGDLTTTVVRPGGRRQIVRAETPRDPPIDCFYVYPTASTQTTPNASLRVDRGVVAAAQLQAARFSQVCRVYAPVYRQLTLTGLRQTGITGATPAPGTPPANFSEPYQDVAAAWTDYYRHFNHGRGVVLIGHSQGSFLLAQLIRQKIEKDPGALHHLVSAILPGGNIQVNTSPSSTAGATFTSVPPCRSAAQNRCVVAYSTFPSLPPTNAIFGRANGIASAGPGGGAGDTVVCTNPAALVGAKDLSTYFPTDQDPLSAGSDQPTVSTPWVEYPDLFSGVCLRSQGASWLQVSRVSNLGNVEPPLTEVLGPTWGYHLDDINLVLGDLVHLVCHQSSAYLHRDETCPGGALGVGEEEGHGS